MSIKLTIARPYAKAVFAAALEQQSVAAWSDLLQNAAAIVSDPEVMVLLQNPRIAPEERLTWLLDICAPWLHEPGKNFFKLLAAKDRLVVLPEIAALFAIYRTEQEKIAQVIVVSAAPLNNALQQRLTQALRTRLQREVILDYQLDENLLGGFVVRAGDLVIDGSIRGKLARLGAALMN